MQKPYDVMAKGIVEGALSGPCTVRSEEEVVADARAIDSYVEPDRARLAELADRGILGRVGLDVCVIEAHHDPPSPDDVDDCELKVIALHARQRAAWKALPPAKRGAPPPRPALWIVSAGSPDAVIAAWAMEPIAGWPSGCFATRGVRGPRLIVASLLPRTRDTLLARLMGAGDTLRNAYDDLHALPDDAWERPVVQPLLTLLRRDLPRMGVTMYTPDEEAMIYQEAVKYHDEQMRLIRTEGLAAGRTEGLAAGRTEGLAAGRTEGRTEGLAPLLHQFERRLRREVTAAERASLLARLSTVGADRLGDVVLDLDAAQLAAWIADPDAR